MNTGAKAGGLEHSTRELLFCNEENKKQKLVRRVSSTDKRQLESHIFKRGDLHGTLPRRFLDALMGNTVQLSSQFPR